MGKNKGLRVILVIMAAFVMAILAASCGKSHVDDRLLRADRLMESDPHAAKALLDSIDSKGFSESDKALYDFMAFKATDKCGIRHESDSMFLRISDYYSYHKNSEIYPEVMYYGGLVYSDIGDYPTALHYFQSALDRLPAEKKNLRLRGKALANMGHVYTCLRLYDKAKDSYYESIRIDSLMNDSIFLMDDLNVLGSININQGKYKEAELILKRAREIATNVNSPDTCRQDMYLAYIDMRKGNLDSALSIIPNVIRNIDSVYRSTALSHASIIYLNAGKPDSAYKYARQLVDGNDTLNKKNGYNILLSPEVRKYMPLDSILALTARYRDFMEDHLNRHDSQEALLQSSYYNYSIHKRERLKAEREAERLKIWIAIILSLLFMAMTIFFYRKYKHSNHQLKLHISLDKVTFLKKALDSDLERRDNDDSAACSDVKSDQLDNETNICPNTTTDMPMDVSKRLQNELLALHKISEGKKTVSPQILQSQAYMELQKMIENDKAISESNPLWDEIEKTVVENAAGFKERLMLLAGDSLKKSDYHITLLIKCGITPTQMTTVLGRTKGTISYRRETLCKKFFGEKLGAKTFDDIIRLL